MTHPSIVRALCDRKCPASPSSFILIRVWAQSRPALFDGQLSGTLLFATAAHLHRITSAGAGLANPYSLFADIPTLHSTLAV